MKALRCARLDFVAGTLVENFSAKNLTVAVAEVQPAAANWTLAKVPGSEFEISADTVILATGQVPGSILKHLLPQARLGADGKIWIDPQTGMTSVENIFAAGEVAAVAQGAAGGGSIVEAMTSGKRAAQHIERLLKK